MTATSEASVETALGTIGVRATSVGIARVRLPSDATVFEEPRGEGGAVDNAVAAAEQLDEYVRGERTTFELALDWSGVAPDHRRVLETLCEIAPYGRTVTYGELGRAAGVDDPREIGVMMATNPLPLVVPCHRVVASDGLGGYGGGLDLKQRLLELEGVLPARLDLGV